MPKRSIRRVGDHGAGAVAALLVRLEDEHGRAVEVAGLGEIFGRAEQHGHVPVMAAGVHPARHGGGMGAPPVSWIGSASMSERRPITRPEVVRAPRMTPTTPERPMPVTTSSQPKDRSFSATIAAVRGRSKFELGMAMEVPPPGRRSPRAARRCG
jgi:hypothetical protein